MATSYPYTSAQGSLVKAFEQFRRNFPPTIDAAILQKFSIAPANESYVISTVKFLGLVDENNKTVDKVGDFFRAGDGEFKKGLDDLLKVAYADLYTEQGAEPWAVTKEALTTWFRVTDKTSELIGQRQAATYLTLASLAGHGEPIKPAAASPKAASSTSTGKPAGPKRVAPAVAEAGNKSGAAGREGGSTNPVGLTVRVEVNLPADATPDVYDSIFASIRKNLLNP